MTRKPDFTDTIAKMSNPAVLDYAEGALGTAHQRAAAKMELRHRVRHGLVGGKPGEELDFSRAAKILNLA